MPTLTELNSLRDSLEISWSKESSADADNWTSANASYGQCAVTALAVQDLLGGEILWAEALLPDGSKVSHYFNEIKGKPFDFTSNQFPYGTKIGPGIPKPGEFASTRRRLLSNENTKRRYIVLGTRLSLQRMGIRM